MTTTVLATDPVAWSAWTLFVVVPLAFMAAVVRHLHRKGRA